MRLFKVNHLSQRLTIVKHYYVYFSNTNQYFLLLYSNIYTADPFIVSYFYILHEKEKLVGEKIKKNK